MSYPAYPHPTWADALYPPAVVQLAYWIYGTGQIDYEGMESIMGKPQTSDEQLEIDSDPFEDLTQERKLREAVNDYLKAIAYSHVDYLTRCMSEIPWSIKPIIVGIVSDD
jgi:hypothetical protein